MNTKHITARFILVLFILLLASGSIFYAVSIPRYATSSQATGGMIDLTSDIFTKNLYALDGEWEFYYGYLYTPEDFATGEPVGRALIQVPLSWNRAGYPLYGSATYRLIMKIDEPEITIHLPEMQNSSTAWINGHKVYEAGTPGYTRPETTTGIKNSYIPINPIDGEIEIIIQAANYGWYTSGLVSTIEVARSDVLLRDAMLRWILMGVTTGIQLAVAFYHLVIYIYDRKKPVYLVFFLFCIAASLRFFVDADGFATILLPGGVGLGLSLVYAACMASKVLLLTLFTHLVFDIPISKVRRIIYIVAYFTPLTVIMILPYGTVNVQIAYVAMIPMTMAFISALRSKQLARYPFYGLYLFALGLFCLWFPITTILAYNAFFMQGVVTNLFLMFSQCFMLSVGFAETRKREEDLERRTNFYREMSHGLRSPLTVVSTNIQTARRRPEEADSLLKDSQTAIMKMAETIDDALKDGDEGEHSFDSEVHK